MVTCPSCTYVWYKSCKSQATHGVGALCKGLGRNPVALYPRNGLTPREETDSTAFRSFLVVKSKTSLNSAEASFLKSRELSQEGWKWESRVESKVFYPTFHQKNVAANIKQTILLSISELLCHSLSIFSLLYFFCVIYTKTWHDSFLRAQKALKTKNWYKTSFQQFLNTPVSVFMATAAEGDLKFSDFVWLHFGFNVKYLKL